MEQVSNTKQLLVTCFIILFSFYFIRDASAQYKITDTIYYNLSWKICERPVANYYRAGILASYNDKWYYTGNVKDYKIDNTLIMEGIYDDDGLKHGEFKFYYPNGKMEATGRYMKNEMSGDWHWYYSNGNEKAILRFTANDQQFQFVKFVNSKGVTTLENGTGDFLWFTNPFDTLHSTYSLSGSFLSGKRNGEWHFDKPSGLSNGLVGFTERYDEGKFQGTTTDNSKNISSRPYHFYFSPVVFTKTEAIEYDDIFALNGDSSTMNNLIYYLIEHKPTQIDATNFSFDTAFAYIIRTLTQYRNHLIFLPSQKINGKLEFIIGTKGSLENIKFTIDHTENQEEQYLNFLLAKFKNVTMPREINQSKPIHFTIYFNLVTTSGTLVINDKKTTMATTTSQILFSFLPHEKISNMGNSDIEQLKIDALNYRNYLKK